MVYGWGSEQFPRYYVFNDEPGRKFIGTPTGTSLSVLLNVSCDKKHEYIWFMGGDLNSCPDITSLMM